MLIVLLQPYLLWGAMGVLYHHVHRKVPYFGYVFLNIRNKFKFSPKFLFDCSTLCIVHNCVPEVFGLLDWRPNAISRLGAYCGLVIHCHEHFCETCSIDMFFSFSTTGNIRHNYAHPTLKVSIILLPFYSHFLIYMFKQRDFFLSCPFYGSKYWYVGCQLC